jgi:hypothetical protein
MTPPAHPQEVLTDGAAEADDDVRVDAPPHPRCEQRERQELGGFPGAHDGHAMDLEACGHGHTELADHEMHVVTARREALRELEAIPLRATQTIVPLVDERDFHSM